MIKHTPVMTREVIKFLAPSSSKNFIDATCGFGGHSRLILRKTEPRGKLLAIDQDAVALNEAKKNLKNFSGRVTFIKSNFTDLGLVIRLWKVSRVDGILFDLGVSTYQLKAADRGFSFNMDAELDMRMAPDATRLTAKDIVNQWSRRDLRKILFEFGEEPHASAIAREIVYWRRIKPVLKTNELVSIVKRALPPGFRATRKRHFATATFRALRMAVNSELENLESGLKQAEKILSPGGRLVVISFHSLEDRIVKNFFRTTESLKVLTPKPVMASAKEVQKNPSARSGKLRAATKIKNYSIKNAECNS